MRGISLRAAALAASLLVVGRASADVLFQDTFDRPNTSSLDDPTTGVSGSVGSTLPAGGVYFSAFHDPNPGAPDGTANNGGGYDITNNQLRLATGAGTSNLFINHNFTEAKSFSVSLDVVGPTQSTAGQGVSFAVGMSQAEAAGAGDAYNGHPSVPATGTIVPGNKTQDAFGTDTGAADGNVISDFWVSLRGDGSVAWGIGGQTNAAGGSGANDLGSAIVGSKSGTISAIFAAPDFSAGSTVGYSVLFNGVEVPGASGTFTWSGTDENYIGLDARDSTSVTMDNLTVSSVVPEPGALGLIGAALMVGMRRRRR